MAGIFINYRRADSAGWTGRLTTDLQERFGQDAVFQDIVAIDAGEDFVVAIERSLESCSAVLVVIGPEWSIVKDETGTRRLDNPDDTVRLEIARALARKDRLVIPVIVGGARIPKVNELPLELKALARRNYFELSDKRWNYDLDQLVATLVKKAGLTQTGYPASPGPRPAPWRKILSSAMILMVALLAGYWLFPRSNPKPEPKPTPEPHKNEVVNHPGLPEDKRVNEVSDPKQDVIKKEDQGPIKAFEITQPGKDAELPLGEDRTWMLEGTLRLAKEQSETQRPPIVSAEVFKLPERQAIPQTGKSRLSSERGLWRFESAIFSGEGSYEIVVTVSLASEKSDFRTVTVKCVSKATAYRQAIEIDRDRRGAPIALPKKLSSEKLKALKGQVSGMQEEFFSLLENNDLDGAERNATQTLNLLDPVVPSDPDDWDLQNLRAYALKNYAIVMRERGNDAESNRALDGAWKMFQAIRQQKPDDPAAWNGLGSVASMRKDPANALNYIDRALELLPDYEAAKSDRATVVKMLEQQKQPDR